MITGVGGAAIGAGSAAIGVGNQVATGLGKAVFGLGNTALGVGNAALDMGSQVAKGVGNAAIGAGSAALNVSSQMAAGLGNATLVIGVAAFDAGIAALNAGGQVVAGLGTVATGAAGRAYQAGSQVVEGTSNMASSAADYASQLSIGLNELTRESLVKRIIWLKEDLQLSKRCERIREGLLGYLRDDSIFSPLQTAYFASSIDLPYDLSTDQQAILPPRVVALKKIINALYGVEKDLKAVENINVRDDRPNPYYMGIYYDAQKIYREKIGNIYGIATVLNEVGGDIQAILGPQMGELLSVLDTASSAFSNVTPSNIPEDTAKLSAKVIGITTNTLPTSAYTGSQNLESLCQLYFELPSYLENLQHLIAYASSELVDKSIVSAEEYQEKMLKKAQETKVNFESLIGENYSALSLPGCVSVLKKLINHTVDLLTVGAPLTKDAYLKAKTILDTIRHEYLPSLVVELEAAEEDLALKPNLLVGPATLKIEHFYKKLAGYVDKLAVAADVMHSKVDKTSAKLAFKIIAHRQPNLGDKLSPIADLDVLRDDEFEAYTTEHALKRLVQAQCEAVDKRQTMAAEAFFDFIDQLDLDSSLADISQESKAALIKHYKHFQPHFAALFPEIDLLIVTQLTKKDDPTFLAKASWVLKAAWGSTDCDVVLDCKPAVIASIQQVRSHALFKTALIREAAMQRESDLYNARQDQTQLSIAAKPFVALELVNPQGMMSTDYDKKRVLFEEQLHHLIFAREALRDFTSYRLAHSTDHKGKIGKWSDEKKEILRQTYKKFQAHLIAEQPDALLYQESLRLNELIVEALSPGKNKAPLLAQKLSDMEENLSSKLDELIEQTSETAKAFTTFETVKRERELLSLELKPMGALLKKKTLLGRISELKLSGVIQGLIDNQYQDFLKNKDNIDPEDYKRLDPSKLPFVDIYEDTADIRLHKQLLNALYHLQKGLSKIEAIDNSGLLKGVHQQSHYLGSIIKAAKNLAKLKVFFNAASQDQAFVALINEGLNCLNLLKNIPILGAYLNTATSSVEDKQPPLNIIAAWKAQQAIVTRNRGDYSEDALEEVPEVDDDVYFDAIEPAEPAPAPIERSLLQQIAQELYRRPLLIRSLDSDPVVVDQESERLIKKQEKDFLDKFEDLSYYNPGSIKKILLALQEINAQVRSMGKESRDLVHRQLLTLPKNFSERVLSIADNAEFNLGLKKPGILSKKLVETFNAFYSNLIDTLNFKADQEGLQLLVDCSPTIIQSQIANETNRLHALEEAKVPSEVALRRTIFVNLALLSPLKGCIATAAQQHQFLEIYEKLQPFLVAIDSKYNRKLFLRALQKPADFNHAIDKILALTPKLERYVRAEVRTKNKEIERCEQRITHLNAMLESERGSAQQKVDAFKNKVFLNHLNANVRSQFEQELGPYTTPFMAHISPQFHAQQADLLLNIGLEEDIESRIAAVIDSAQPDILQAAQLLKDAYAALNTSQNTLISYIAIEADLNLAGTNPCRLEKLTVLRNEQQRLAQLVLVADTDVQTINAHQLTLDRLLSRVSEYNTMIKIYDTLQELSTYLKNHEDPTTGEKIVELDKLKNILDDTAFLPRERLRALEVHGTSHACKGILLKNSDNVFIRMLKSFWSFITGWQYKDHRLSIFQKSMENLGQGLPQQEAPNHENIPDEPEPGPNGSDLMQE